MVMVLEFYETRKKGGSRGFKPVEKKAPLSKEARVQSSHANQREGNETNVAEAQIMETFNAHDDTSLKLTELKGDINGNKDDFMEKQIKEIDRELNDFDILGSKIRGTTANHNEVLMVATPLIETIIDLPSETETGHEAGAGHVDHLNPQSLGTNEKPQPDT